MTEMTIARGLTRLKTIKAQLANNNDTLAQSCVSSKRKSQLADAKTSLDSNHKKAQESVSSALQSSLDLIKEYTAIKMAIAKSNQETKFEIAGQTMTVAEAILFRRDIRDVYSEMLSSINRSRALVEREVDRRNDKIISDNKDLSPSDVQQMLEDVVQFVSPEKSESLRNFITVFMAEIDGTLNEINATTKITV